MKSETYEFLKRWREKRKEVPSAVTGILTAEETYLGECIEAELLAPLEVAARKEPAMLHLRSLNGNEILVRKSAIVMVEEGGTQTKASVVLTLVSGEKPIVQKSPAVNLLRYE